ncbi:c-type cytochrome [Paenibacillus popilliae]|uniref:Cytochrome C n=1 Tax=Paenibacillus popilliae ATCC 14706 TaxID=1212764 RepID=M9M0E8_PAEPP|nr:cytochrome c [Paenibacillus popilliae]GAC42219.1 cytochrome C [Paenibacillus popilliae ATCC 14706]
MRTRKLAARAAAGGALLLTISMLLTACGGSSSASTLAGPEEAVAVYKQRCMQCHGNELQGLMGPESNLQQVGERLSKEAIVNTIKNGGNRMPAQRNIDPDDIDRVAEWLASKK